MIIGIPIPNNYFAPWGFVKSLMNLPYHKEYAQGPYIYANRNLLLQKAKHLKESILMIDADLTFSALDVERVERHLKTKDVVSGLYVVGTEPYPPCVYKRWKDDYVLAEPPSELSRVDAVGGGFLGINRDIVQALPDEAFNDVWEGKIKHGEDISFCHRLKELGFDLWLDPAITLGHLRVVQIKPSIV